MDQNNNHYQDHVDEYQFTPEWDPVFSNENGSHSGSEIASLILGIVSIVFICCGGLGLIPGVIGIVLAIKARRDPYCTGMSVAGMVCSLIGTVFSSLVGMFLLFMILISLIG